MTYTYSEYLRNWEDRFGDDDVGDYEYYRGKERIPHQVRRLSQEQFDGHVAALAKANDGFKEALLADSDEGMERALEDAFPHQLVLLL